MTQFRYEFVCLCIYIYIYIRIMFMWYVPWSDVMKFAYSLNSCAKSVDVFDSLDRVISPMRFELWTFSMRVFLYDRICPYNARQWFKFGRVYNAASQSISLYIKRIKIKSSQIQRYENTRILHIISFVASSSTQWSVVKL